MLCHLCFPTWMDLGSIMLNERSQTKRQTLYVITYMQNLKKYKLSEYNKQKQMLGYKNKLVVNSGERENGRVKWGIGLGVPSATYKI